MSSSKLLAILLASTSLLGCLDGNDGDEGPPPVLKDGPDDGRRPELGDDPTVVFQAKVTMSMGLAQATQTGVVIEAKYELGDDGALSLSTYPIGAPIAMDSERSVFQELAGDPTTATWAPSLEAFHDEAHLKVSSRDLTLVQLGALSLPDAVAQESSRGFVYWAIPTIHAGHSGYGVFAIDTTGKNTYRFVDNNADHTRQVVDLGTGPGDAATDARGPELGDDVTIARTSKLTMATALAQVERDHGTPIEAKFEVGEDGTLSLSVYPADLEGTPESTTFVELAADPTATSWSPGSETFAAPDEEHLTRSARDMTLVQTASLSLRDAVAMADAKFPGGFVYWAIPTRRGTTSGYGVYILDAQNLVHYLFIS